MTDKPVTIQQALIEMTQVGRETTTLIEKLNSRLFWTNVLNVIDILAIIAMIYVIVIFKA